MLGDGSVVRAGQVVIATGVRDELPAVPGLAQRWGHDVVHCPYCHGWEIRDQRIGLLATGPMSAMQALLFHQWSGQMRFFPNGTEFPTAELDKLAAVGITVTPGPVTGLEVTDDQLTGVRMQDGTRIEVDALAVPALTRARLNGLEGLGVEVTTSAAGVAVVADPAGHTSVPGVWAAGNVVNPSMQVSEAAANGARVAMTVNTELVLQHADHALQRRQSDTGRV
ncbi:MAG: NAD(P)/FAD-dependent oxidoreductase [Nocardiopsaceae bacterium]|nr:NAD(P)/FAD-dependent oxidoreductase [Nocardiopsaceae bacterium]